jgi:hypothetical protein
VLTLEMNSELSLTNKHTVTLRTLYRVGMNIVKMTIEGFLRVKPFVA